MADGDTANLTGNPYTSTNIMDPNNMPSANAAMARQKSDDVMAALKKNDGSADRMMGKADDSADGNGLGSLKNWIKRKLGPGNGENRKPQKPRQRKAEDTGGIEGLKGNSGGLGVEDSSPGIVVGDPAPAGDILARDGGKGDGVIR